MKFITYKTSTTVVTFFSGKLLMRLFSSYTVPYMSIVWVRHFETVNWMRI